MKHTFNDIIEQNLYYYLNTEVIKIIIERPQKKAFILGINSRKAVDDRKVF